MEKSNVELLSTCEYLLLTGSRNSFQFYYNTTEDNHVAYMQALTGTRYPTLPGFYFYYPYPTRKSFENFRVQGSNYTCCFHLGLYQ